MEEGGIADPPVPSTSLSHLILSINILLYIATVKAGRVQERGSSVLIKRSKVKWK